MLVFNKSKCKI